MRQSASHNNGLSSGTTRSMSQTAHVHMLHNQHLFHRSQPDSTSATKCPYMFGAKSPVQVPRRPRIVSPLTAVEPNKSEISIAQRSCQFWFNTNVDCRTPPQFLASQGCNPQLYGIRKFYLRHRDGSWRLHEQRINEHVQSTEHMIWRLVTSSPTPRAAA